MTGQQQQQTTEEEWERVFSSLDVCGQGSVNTEHLSVLLSNLGHQLPSKTELQKMIEEVDVAGIGHFTFSQFKALIERRKVNGSADPGGSSRTGNTETMKEAFRMFDHDNDGFITAAEFKRTMEMLGENLSDAKVDEVIRAADVDGDGKINYEEFLKTMIGIVDS